MSVKFLISSGFLLLSGLLILIFCDLPFIGWCITICGAVPILYTWGKETMDWLDGILEKTAPAKKEEKKE